MGDVEILVNEEGTLKVVQLYDLRLLLRRLKGFGRHRVLRWLNCKSRPLDFKVSNTTKSPSSQDDLFNLFLKAFFFIILSLGLIKILFELSVIGALPSISTSSPNYCSTWRYSYGYTPDKMCPFDWSRLMLLVMLIAVVAVAAAIVKKKMKNISFTQRRKEEVKTVSGLIQQV